MEADTLKDRRTMLRLAVAAAGSALGCTAQPNQAGEPAKEMGGRGTQMVERARALGREYEARNGNCAQCTIAALQDAVEIVPKDEKLFLAGTGLSGGATSTGNANCGGFTGSGIIFGALCGRTREKFGDRAAGKLAGECVREIAARYEAEYGSVLCKDVRERAGKQCPEVVSRAAGWAAEIILKRFPA